LVIAVGAWRSYRSFRSGSLIELRGDDAVVASSAIAFPLLCFLTASVILARVWVVSLRRGTRSIRRVPTGLALRRLQHGRRTGSVFVALGALAVAVSLYGAGLVASLDHTQAVKTGVYVGSDVSVRVRVPVTTAVEGATQVRHRDEATYEGTDVGLLAVDPRSFEQAAFWDDSFSEQSLSDLMLLLRSPTASGSAPAIVVGNLPPTGTLGNTKGRPGRLDIEVVAVARAFPGLDDQPLVVIGADAAERSEFKFSYDVWARGDVDEWRRRLAALGVGPVSAVTRNDVVTSSELLFASWTFVFVRALGVFVAGLVVVSLALQLVTRQRQQALGFGILRRMGVSARLHRGALMLEALALGLAMFAGGALAAAIASRTVAPRVDPLPVIPPGPTSVTPVAALAAIVAAVAVTCLAGASVAQRMGSQVNLAMGLRDD
jgi:putative ABC transport system permease protein